MNNTDNKEVIYRFKKDHPDYYENRKKRLIDITKERYKNDEEFRNKMKETSNEFYRRLRELAGVKKKI